MAAGILLIGEAGGKCSDMRGGRVALRNPHLLADNGLVHEGMLGIFDDVFHGKYRYPIPEIK
jgi:fructose-1,6-bisphosphatase/inositol monophosphatase family enzyme